MVNEASKRNEDLKRYNKIGFFTLGGVVLLVLMISVIGGVQSSNVKFDVVTESRFLHLDYSPNAILDKEWDFTFYSVITTEGSGDYEVEYYPMVVRWNIYAQDYLNSTDIASQDYRQGLDDYQHPYEEIDFTYIFSAIDFSKGSVVLKLRVDIDVGNESYSHPMKDSVDFMIELEGLITGIEFLYYVCIPVVVLLSILIRSIIATKLNNKMIEKVDFINVDWVIIKAIYRQLCRALYFMIMKRRVRKGKVIEAPSYLHLSVEADLEWSGYDNLRDLEAFLKKYLYGDTGGGTSDTDKSETSPSTT